MSVARALARIRTIRAELDEVERALTEGDAPPEPKRLAPRVSAATYARERGYTADTIHRYADLGMPHVGSGKGLRVLVDAADAWLADNGPAKARERARRAGAQDAAVKALQ